MPAKCDRCRAETSLDASFSKVPKSFSRAVQTFCPTRGAVLVAMGRFEEAVPYLQEAMALAEIPNHKATSACLLSIVQVRHGNLAGAQQYLTEARKMEPRCHLLARAERAIKEASPLIDDGSG